MSYTAPHRIHTNTEVVPCSRMCGKPHQNADIGSLPQANIFKHVTSLSETQIHRIFSHNVIKSQPPPDTMGPEQKVQRCVIRDNVCLF